jgi:hypothetical protein
VFLYVAAASSTRRLPIQIGLQGDTKSASH